VSEKALEMRHFWIFPCPEEVELAPSRSAAVGRDKEMKKKALTEAVGCTINSSQDGEMEILDNISTDIFTYCRSTSRRFSASAERVENSKREFQGRQEDRS
jgi:hypothetical protein